MAACLAASNARCAAPLDLRPMRLDPNTHAFVYATAFLTSLTFAIFAMNVIAGVLYYLL